MDDPDLKLIFTYLILYLLYIFSKDFSLTNSSGDGLNENVCKAPVGEPKISVSLTIIVEPDAVDIPGDGRVARVACGL